ncbi:hypothetical protein VNO77_43978 [Canavalia gladiata]|uniref:Uncharacterized protein n=1 Tax=Canavalia gladiata TaxID=3824 RepID=A0AAN9JXQ6_CANGL
MGRIKIVVGKAKTMVGRLKRGIQAPKAINDYWTGVTFPNIQRRRVVKRKQKTEWGKFTYIIAQGEISRYFQPRDGGCEKCRRHNEKVVQFTSNKGSYDQAGNSKAEEDSVGKDLSIGMIRDPNA